MTGAAPFLYARKRPLTADCVEKLPFGDVRFSGRPMGAVFKKSAGGPANLSIGQRARSSTGLRWCWAAMFHRIAIWGVFVTLDFSTFSTQSAHFGLWPTPSQTAQYGRFSVVPDLPNL